MSGASVFELNAVQKRLGNFTLSVDKLTIEPRETFCLLGPTGAGKSTLLRLLSLLDPPTSGRIVFQGAPIPQSHVPLAVVRRIASVPQRPLPLSDTVRHNVDYGLRVRRLSSIAARAHAVLDRLGLAGIAEQDAGSLSGGQLQLVALARALVIEPEVLLLDEPTAHLDPANVALVESVIREQQQRTGMTVVWASHNLFQARRMASRIGWLLEGSIVEVANPQDFFENPADERTKQFVDGRMVY
jgi:tungstate transport system ATP-binding protein